MDTYKVNVNLNGYLTFEVQASSREEAEQMVNEMLQDSSVSHALEKYADTLRSNIEIKEKNIEKERNEKKDYER